MTTAPAMRYPLRGRALSSAVQPAEMEAAARETPAAETILPEQAGLHRIVVVGGGAGGLELATMLGDKLGKNKRAHVTLIEKKRTHFWKPHLHQIAAGSMDIGVYETNYLAQGHWHHFRYRVGEMIGLDRERRPGQQVWQWRQCLNY